MKSIESVINQSYKNWELLIIDDGSTDDSWNVAKTYISQQTSAIQDKCFLYQQTNSGVAVTRNYGISIAKGDFVSFLDADDWWSPIFLERMLSLVSEYPDYGIYTCRFFVVKNKKNTINPAGIDKKFKSGVVDYIDLLLKDNTRPICTGSCIIPITVCKKIDGFNNAYKYGEDFDFHFRCYLFKGLVLLNEPLLYYNQDVDISQRAVSGHLYSKEESAFFHLNYSKQKVDIKLVYFLNYLKLRSYYPYYLNGMYKNEINQMLKEINILNYDFKYLLRYKIVPIYLQNFWLSFRKKGSLHKQQIIKWIRKG